ncbi:hypothetical protein BO99DRAFT_437262 [Aspergillus violaceofuscus CBS 115571]|uniref:Uncharacterized protein n=1 Tax=Aspergillus violaceofuscus (strain CBS 115571) TaxID=1450538 RepID=A0A2V5GTQ2_ASPV1|nr:hypothetical protein BO99DRAFT_437262 [Aspergillus violaceofuscus CBS 115571]
MAQPAPPANKPESRYDASAGKSPISPTTPSTLTTSTESQLVAATETLPPSAQQLEPALQQSRAEHTGPVSPPWPAPSISTAFHPDSVDPTPAACSAAFPACGASRKPPMRFYMGASPSQILCFQASACWRRNGSTDGGIPADTPSPVLLHLGTKAAVPYAFEGGGFRQWMGAGAAEGNAYPWTSSPWTTVECRTNPSGLSFYT